MSTGRISILLLVIGAGSWLIQNSDIDFTNLVVPASAASGEINQEKLLDFVLLEMADETRNNGDIQRASQLYDIWEGTTTHAFRDLNGTSAINSRIDSVSEDVGEALGIGPETTESPELTEPLRREVAAIFEGAAT